MSSEDDKEQSELEFQSGYNDGYSTAIDDVITKLAKLKVALNDVEQEIILLRS